MNGDWKSDRNADVIVSIAIPNTRFVVTTPTRPHEGLNLNLRLGECTVRLIAVLAIIYQAHSIHYDALLFSSIYSAFPQAPRYFAFN